MYAQLQRLIGYGYQQEGVSEMAASSEKPAGLNSGEAIRSFDDISTDRMATLSRKYDDFFIHLAYAIMSQAIDIAKEQGAYQTVFPNKDGTKEIDLPDIKLLQNPFVIQCFNESSLPRDPAGRKQTVIEYMQAGMLSVKEGRRLLDFPDLSQSEKLANAAEERIFQILDKIIEDGEFTPADPFIDIQLATELTTEYINLYSMSKLEEDRMQMLRDFFTQVQAIKQVAMTPPPMAPGAPGSTPMPQANPEAPPTSPMLPNAPNGQ
jgi:hypothetical protein